MLGRPPQVSQTNASGDFLDVCLRDSDRHRGLLLAAQRPVDRLWRRGSRRNSVDPGREPAHDNPTGRAVPQATLREVLVEENASGDQQQSSSQQSTVISAPHRRPRLTDSECPA